MADSVPRRRNFELKQRLQKGLLQEKIEVNPEMSAEPDVQF